uniref:cold-shock protein n=1 Tax=Alistipes sp. TaxID=1872444 RepID=UPI0040578552
MTGTVKWFDSKKGYGFLICEDGKEVFVHYTGIVAEGFRSLTEKQRVEFEIEGVDRGEQAINVHVLE